MNRSLTGKDIEKRSVPLNRLKGRPLRGRRGRRGPQGKQGPPGPVDPSRFLPSNGSTTVGRGPHRVGTDGGGNPAERTAVEGNRVEWSSPVASGGQFLLLEPTLPTELADRPVRLVAATLCYSTLEPDVRLTAVFMSHNRGPLNGFGASSLVGTQFDDLTIRDESACRRFTLPQPFLLRPGDYVNVRLRFDFDAADKVHVGASSFELAPA